MFCLHCSHRNHARARHCKSCGKPLRERGKARFLPPVDPIRSASTPAGGWSWIVDAVGALVGTKIGSYKIERKIGEGGMGAVYLATQIELNRKVAFKVFPPSLSKDRELVERFRREAQILASLDHTSIVPIHDCFIANGLVCITMGYAAGGSLRDMIDRQEQLRESQVISLVRQASLGLWAAAQAGVVHRDVKPDNLLLSDRGQLKICDFGLARSVTDGRRLTATTMTIGTPGYMPPEQWRDSHSVDHRSDLYSLGCTLYELLTGELPFPGPTPENFMNQHIHEPIPDVREKRPDISKRVDDLIVRLLQKDPDLRFQNGADLARALLLRSDAGAQGLSRDPGDTGRTFRGKRKEAAELLPPVSKSPPPDDASAENEVAATRPLPALELQSRPAPEVEMVPAAQSRDSKPCASGHPTALGQAAPLKQEERFDRARPFFSKAARWLIVVALSSALLLMVVVVTKYPSGGVVAGTDSAGQSGRVKIRTPIPKTAALTDLWWEPTESQRSVATETAPAGMRNSLGMDFVLIPRGDFRCGSPAEEPGHSADETPFQVSLSRSFFMKATEVTTEEYARVTQRIPSFFRHAPPENPVESVTWYDAVMFCNRLSEADQLTPAYEISELIEEDGVITQAIVRWPDRSATGYRLPTEAEWEFACRGGISEATYFGPLDLAGHFNCPDLESRVWFGGNSSASYAGTIDLVDYYHTAFERDGIDTPAVLGVQSTTSGTQPVAQMPPNPYGLFDMLGNVWEWCWDYYAPYPSEPQTDPTGPPEGDARVWRGAAWSSFSSSCRSAQRLSGDPGSRVMITGFRVARTAE